MKRRATQITFNDKMSSNHKRTSSLSNQSLNIHQDDSEKKIGVKKQMTMIELQRQERVQIENIKQRLRENGMDDFEIEKHLADLGFATSP